MTRPWAWVLGAALASAILAGGYAAAGGLSYHPAGTPNPCKARHWPHVSGTSQVAQQLMLSALDGAACKLGVSSEELTVALVDRSHLAAFERQHGVSGSRFDDAARAGISRAIDDGERSGAINGLEAIGLRLAARLAPIDRLIEYVRNGLGG